MKIQRGFKHVRKMAMEKAKYIAQCDSCRSFYADSPNEDDYCHNPNVTDYDMVYEENGRVYCGYWNQEE
jgi:hypothetical protein